MIDSAVLLPTDRKGVERRELCELFLSPWKPPLFVPVPPHGGVIRGVGCGQSAHA